MILPRDLNPPLSIDIALLAHRLLAYSEHNRVKGLGPEDLRAIIEIIKSHPLLNTPDEPAAVQPRSTRSKTASQDLPSTASFPSDWMIDGSEYKKALSIFHNALGYQTKSNKGKAKLSLATTNGTALESHPEPEASSATPNERTSSNPGPIDNTREIPQEQQVYIDRAIDRASEKTMDRTIDRALERFAAGDGL